MSVHHQICEPFVIVTNAGEVTEENVAYMRDLYTEVHARGRRFATIIDCREAIMPSSAVRRSMADLANEFADRAELNTICVGLILGSRAAVGVFTAIQWFMRQKSTRYFASAAEAFADAEARCRAEGVLVSQRAREAVLALDDQPR